MKKLLKALVLVLIVSTISGPTFADDPKDRLAIIVHPKVPKKAVKKSEVERYFLKQKTTWSDNQEIVVYSYRTKVELLKQFSSLILKKSVGEVQRYWIEKKITAAIVAPKRCRTEEQMLKRVSSKPGAMGFVSYEKAKLAASQGKVKIVLIIP